MIIAALLCFAAQQPLSSDELLAMAWDGNSQHVYQQIFDSELSIEDRARLAEYAIIFDGHQAIDEMSELLQPDAAPALVIAALQRWRSCVQTTDRDKLFLLAEKLDSRTAFSALRTLAALAETATDYISLIELALARDVKLAQRIVSYLPKIADDDFVFRDFVTSQLSASNPEYSAAMLNKASEYHTDESFLELFNQRVPQFNARKTALWMTSIARRRSEDCKRVAMQWLLSAQDVAAEREVNSVSIYLSTSSALDGYEDLYMRHPLLTEDQSSTVLQRRIGRADSATTYAIDYFDDLSSSWQIKNLESFARYSPSAALPLYGEVAMGSRYLDGVRAAAIRASVKHKGVREFPAAVSELLNSDWLDYATAEALIEVALARRELSAEQLLILIDQQQLLADLRIELQRALYKACGKNLSLDNAKFLAKRFVFEIKRVQQIENLTQNLSSIDEAAHLDPSFNALLESLVAHAGVNDTYLSLNLDYSVADEHGAVMLIYASTQLAGANPQIAFHCLQQGMSKLTDKDSAWYLRGLCLKMQFADQLEQALIAAESLTEDPDKLDLYEFAVRESFNPHGAEWHNLSESIAHRKVFISAQLNDDPFECAKFLDGYADEDILLRAAQAFSLYQNPRRQDVLDFAVSLAQHAVDLSPFSTDAHQVLIECNEIAEVDGQLQKIANDRLKRLTNRR
ncbi:MAG: hypothetical protein H8E25_12060 [Planctomycetes bacterium]|nr:hypothetical protein [Planctomycetota bacterium]